MLLGSSFNEVAQDDGGQKPFLALWNKADIAPVLLAFPFTANGLISISAKTGAGMADLSEAITAAVKKTRPLKIRFPQARTLPSLVPCGKKFG